MHGLVTLAEYSVEEILPLIGQKGHKVEIDGKTYYAGLDSIRLRTFKKCLTCYRCGITGSKFLLQNHIAPHNNPARPHYNLYAVDSAGKLVLMTKDHLFPKSKGGSNALHNMHTMCEICNLKKGPTIKIHLVTERRNGVVQAVKAFTRFQNAKDLMAELQSTAVMATYNITEIELD